jgi:hypothetical protein
MPRVRGEISTSTDSTGVAVEIRGVGSDPPVATAEIIRAIWIGVTASRPWPMATEIVSPGYHGPPRLVRFHWRDGRIPAASAGRSTPVGRPSPNRAPYWWIRSMPSRLPS